MATVFVMGGTGFLGKETVKSLVKRGDTVYGLARSRESEDRLQQLGAIPVPGDVYTPERWIRHLPDMDYVINVLGFFKDGKPARLSVKFSVVCREKYIKWARTFIDVTRLKGVKLGVHVTGTTVYEDGGNEWVNEDTPLRFTKNGFNRIAAPATQLMVEEMAKGVPIVVAVAPNIVYGDEPDTSFDQVFVRPLKNWQMGIVGQGKNYITTGHVEDVGRAIAFLTDSTYAGEFFHISGDDPVTQKEFFTAIARGLGRGWVPRLPEKLVSVLGGKCAREFMCLSQRIDNRKLKSAGFTLKHPRFLDEIDQVMARLQEAWKRESTTAQPERFES
ncbi:MAG TPA: NAD-dependent epimerase/dehydratase family protein [Gammaproteobacteria bacterium]|nr:NAD-dependent epimerase/dehydratase family protein [Gammaproteobacteria bacterium]